VTRRRSFRVPAAVKPPRVSCTWSSVRPPREPGRELHRRSARV